MSRSGAALEGRPVSQDYGGTAAFPGSTARRGACPPLTPSPAPRVPATRARAGERHVARRVRRGGAVLERPKDGLAVVNRQRDDLRPVLKGTLEHLGRRHE